MTAVHPADEGLNYRFIAKTEVVIGRSQPGPRSGEGCDQADHGRPVVFMVLEHVPVGSRRTLIFEKSLGMRKHSWCRQFRWRSTGERNFDVRRHRCQSPCVIECHKLLRGCDTRLHLDFDPYWM